MIAVIINCALIGNSGLAQRLFPNFGPAEMIVLIVALEVRKYTIDDFVNSSTFYSAYNSHMQIPFGLCNTGYSSLDCPRKSSFRISQKRSFQSL